METIAGMTITPTAWAILGVVLLITEILVPAFLFLWFGAAAFVVAVMAALGVTSMTVQLLAFAFISTALVLASRTIFKDYFFKTSPGANTRTNADALVGLVGLVIAPVDNLSGTGQVKLQGMEWSARSASGTPIAEGMRVKVVSVEGVKLIVEPETAAAAAPNPQGQNA